MPSEPEGMMVSEPGPSAAGEACRLIDLGVWLDEGYVVPGEPPDDVR